MMKKNALSVVQICTQQFKKEREVKRLEYGSRNW